MTTSTWREPFVAVALILGEDLDEALRAAGLSESPTSWPIGTEALRDRVLVLRRGDRTARARVLAETVARVVRALQVSEIR